MPPLRMRTIVRDELFAADLAATVELGDEKADAFLEAVELVLSRRPECGKRFGESHVWFISGHTTDLIVYYTFDDDTVFLLSIQRSPVLET